MKVAIDNFAAMDVTTPKAVILGDMRELGPTSEFLHAEIVNQIEAAGFDKVYLCGDHFSTTGTNFLHFKSIDELIAELTSNPLKGYHILIKGSRGMTLEKTLPLL